METKTVIKYNRLQKEAWIEQLSFPLDTVIHITEAELNQMLENGEIKRVNGNLTDNKVKGKKRVNPIEIYEGVKKENSDSLYTKVEINIDYNRKTIEYEGDEVVYSEILEWPEFASLENIDEYSRTYSMKRKWVKAFFEEDSFLKAKKAHLEFQRKSQQNILNQCAEEQKIYSSKIRNAMVTLEQIEKELKELPFCRICGSLLKHFQPIPMPGYMMHSWTCQNPKCKSSEMRTYKEVK